MRGLIPALLALALAGCATTIPAAAPAPAVRPLVVADRLYWSEGEGNLAATVTGKFNRLADLALELDPDRVIGEFRGVPVKFYNILVAVDCNGNGLIATWRVSGPAPLITSYLERLRTLAATPGVFYDFSSDTLAVAPTAAFEREEEGAD